MAIVKSFSVGEGDMYYIKHNSSNFTIIDCCINEEDQERIINEIKEEKKNKDILRFISTHPDDDHIMGIKELDEKFNFLNFYCVENNITKEPSSEDFKKYCQLRDSNKSFFIKKGCERRFMNLEGTTKDGTEISTSGINVLWPITSNDHFKKALISSEENANLCNNISPIIKYSSGMTFMWMGDMETSLMDNIIDDIDLPRVDVLFAPHHGRDSGKVPEKWLNQMKPKIIVIGEADSSYLNYYTGYNTLTQNSAKDITFEINEVEAGSYINIFSSSSTYEASFLKKYSFPDQNEKYYIGTLL